MADPDSKTEEEKIQAMLQQSSDQWDEQQDQFPVASSQPPVRSPQQFRNPMMGVPPGFNPMLNFAMMNPQLQFQMMMQQQMQQMQQTRPAMGGQSTIPPETQKPPVGYVCFKCRQPGHWIYYCPNVPKGQFVPRPGMNGSNQPQRVGVSGSTMQETQKRQKPTELTCRICGSLMRDAVLVPCCGKSFCKECTYNGIFKVLSILLVHLGRRMLWRLHSCSLLRLPLLVSSSCILISLSEGLNGDTELGGVACQEGFLSEDIRTACFLPIMLLLFYLG
ncbi:hypothetical protein BX666DRAFT_1912872 [Dichotomocladium elegans]|nr:hypothetical protein BX666DRAFT_1912872 [Dichotomocladium elegans]